MKVEILTLCDFAQNIGGKLIIIGAFDVFTVQKLPVIHPICSIAARIRFGNDEVGQHSFKLSVLDGDGKEIQANTHDNWNIQIPPHREWGTVNIVLVINQLKLSSCGKHFISLIFDNKLTMESLPFLVEKI